MNDPKPVPEAKESTVKALSTPTWQSPTWWVSVAGYITAAGSYVSALAMLLESNPQAKMNLLLVAGILAATAGFCGNIGTLLARRGAVHAAAKALETATGTRQSTERRNG